MAKPTVESPEANVGQHTVSRFYLNLFAATTDKKLFVRERGSVAYGPKSTKQLTVENYAFTIWENGEREDGCDDVNWRVENWVAQPLQGLTADRVIQKKEWNAAWFLTANFAARSRRTRDKLKFGLQWAAHIADDAKPILPDHLASAGEEVNRAAELLYPLVVVKGTEVIALALRVKGCDLLVAPLGSSFVTSDDPSVVYVSGQPAMLEIKPGFIERKEVEVFMALKPGIAIHWYDGGQLGVRTLSPEEVARRNQDVYASCYKESYSDRKQSLDALADVGTQ